jgi:hypothetical protein
MVPFEQMCLVLPVQLLWELQERAVSLQLQASYSITLCHLQLVVAGTTTALTYQQHILRRRWLSLSPCHGRLLPLDRHQAA